MKLQCLFLLLVVSIPAIAATSCPAAEHDSPVSPDMPKRGIRAANLTAFEPILIDNDLDFALQCWPGNGTEDDPFRLEGLAISTDKVCVNISNTAAHFVIRNCLFQFNISTYSGFGVYITNASFVTVVQCSIAQLGTGMWLAGCKDCTVLDTTISCWWDAIRVLSSSRVRISSVSIAGAGEGVRFYNSTSCSITSSFFEVQGGAISCRESAECIIDSNTEKGGLSGVVLSGGTRNSNVTHNTLILNYWHGIYISEYSHDNTVYGNTIARNVEHNAEDNGLSNEWDNGAGVGNTWGDYLGLGIYLIPGHAQGVDRYPLAYPPTVWLLLASCGGMAFLIAVVLLLLRKGRANGAVYIVSPVLLVLQFVIPPIENLEQSLPLVNLAVFGLEVMLVVVASRTLRISGLIYTESVRFVDWSFAVVCVFIFAMFSLSWSWPDIFPFGSSAFLLIYCIVVVLPSVAIFAHGIHSRRIGIRGTLDWYYDSLTEKLSHRSVKKMPGLREAKMHSKFYYFEASLYLSLGPLLGMWMGIFSFTLEAAGVLSICIFVGTVGRDLYSRLTGKVTTLPTDGAALFVGLRDRMIAPIVVDVVALLPAFAIINALLFMSAYVNMLWRFLGIVNALILIAFSLANILQARNITDWDTFIHRGSRVALLSLGFMYGIVYLYWDWMLMLPFFSFYMWLPTPIFGLWVVMLAVTVRFSIKRVETSYARFVLRPAVFVFYSFIPYVYLLIEYAGWFEYEAWWFDLSIAVFCGLFLLSLRAKYPIRAALHCAEFGVFDLMMLSLVGIELLWAILLFIVTAVFPASAAYEGSWRKMGPELLNEPDLKTTLTTLLEGPMSFSLFAEKARLEHDRAKETLSILKESGVITVIGRRDRMQFGISSEYYRKRIAAAKQRQTS